MAFINEKISAADREWFNSFQLKDPFTRKPLESRSWTIDRERDAFLVGLGGQGDYESDVPMYYALVWKGNVIFMDTYSTGTGNVSSGIEMFWKITKIEAPGSLLQDHEQLIDLIKGALDAKGFAGRRDCVTAVQFDYIATPVFAMGGVKQ